MTEKPADSPPVSTPSGAVEQSTTGRVDPERGASGINDPAASAAETQAGTPETAAVGTAGLQTGAGVSARTTAGATPPKKESFAATLLSLLIKSVVCAVLLWLFVFQISFVKGESMEPNFQEGDRLVIDKLTYWFSDVQRRDVVVFDHIRPLFAVHAADGNQATERHEDYIKRVIGLPGDLVRIQRGVVYVNGMAQAESYVQHTTVSQLQFYPPPAGLLNETIEADSTGMSAVRVKPGFVFVMGDNRGHSTDSREFGPVKISLIRGKVRIRMLPTDRFRWFAGGE